jgi:hypothetical protein
MFLSRALQSKTIQFAYSYFFFGAPYSVKRGKSCQQKILHTIRLRSTPSTPEYSEYNYGILGFSGAHMRKLRDAAK